MRTYTVVRVPIDEHLPPALPAHKRRHLLELSRGAFPLDLDGLLGDLVLIQAAGVPPPAQYELGIVLGRLHDLVLDVDVDGGLDGAHEARAHVDALGAQAQRGREALAVGETARGDERHLERLARAAQQDEVSDVALAHVAGALEAVDAEEVNAQVDGALGVPDRRALVQDDGVDGLELLDDGPRAVASRLDDLDALVDHHLCVCAVVRRRHGREECDVHAEGLVGHGLALPDLFPQVFWRGLCEGCEDAESASVTDCRGKLRVAYPLHATLNNGDYLQPGVSMRNSCNEEHVRGEGENGAYS